MIHFILITQPYCWWQSFDTICSKMVQVAFKTFLGFLSSLCKSESCTCFVSVCLQSLKVLLQHPEDNRNQIRELAQTLMDGGVLDELIQQKLDIFNTRWDELMARVGAAVELLPFLFCWLWNHLRTDPNRFGWWPVSGLVWADFGFIRPDVVPMFCTVPVRLTDLKF